MRAGGNSAPEAETPAAAKRKERDKMDQAISRRIEQLKQLLADDDLRCYLIPPSPDLYYLTGLVKEQSERLFLAAVWPGGPLLFLVPELESAWVRDNVGECILFTWKEGENPYRLAKNLLGACNAASGRVAVGGALSTMHFLRLTSEVGDVTFVDGSPMTSVLRAVKGPDEQDALKASSKIADEVMAEVPSLIAPGVTEKQIAGTILSLFLKKGATQPWVIVASGPNASYPHHESGERKIADGDVVMVDTGALYKGYNSDITRTFCLGPPPKEVVHAYDAILHAQEAAFKRAIEGVPVREVDVAARKALLEEGLLQHVLHRTGHGIGLEIHEPPYASDVDETILEPGMAFTVEPGVYFEGRFGIRTEDVVIVSEGGAPPQILNSSPKKLELRKP
jgi:Xaa-Pro aminopeptidase